MSHMIARHGALLLLVWLSACTADEHREPGSQAKLLAGSDAGLPAACNAACIAQAPYLCAYDATNKRCVECLSDQHCASNPGALGPTCDTTTGLCRCTADAGCTGKQHGQRCISELLASPVCGCSADADCAAGRKCLGQLFDTSVCAAPCKAHGDCSSPARPRCQTASGRCVACTSPAHCGGQYAPRCSASGSCVACTADAHCTIKGKPRCDDGVCSGCSAHSLCSGSGAGARCLSFSLEPRRCGCGSDADCKSSSAGSSCHAATAHCSCKTDSDCTASGISSCAPPFVGAPYKRCQAPCKVKADCGRGLVCHKASGRCGQCQGNADCASSSAKRCDTKRMTCVACATDGDCAGARPLCDAASGRCVACKVNADCVASTGGPTCVAGACSCGADAHCAGVSVWGTSCLSFAGVQRCGCTSDSACKGKAPGTSCELTVKKCTCKADSECKTKPWTSCQPPYPGAPYHHCEAPCKTDKDCPDPNTAHCNVSNGRCVACTQSSHCATRDWAKLCVTSIHRCLECLQHADCTPKTLGSKCSSNMCGCTAHGDCAANLHGKLCDKDLRVCSCVTATDCPAGKKCEKSTLGTAIKLCQ